MQSCGPIDTVARIEIERDGAIRQTDGENRCIAYQPGNGVVSLEGRFGPEDLRALADHVERHRREHPTAWF